MKRFVLYATLLILIGSFVLPLVAAEQSFEDFLPIEKGMKLKFMYIVAHIENKDKFWNLEIVKNSFPSTLTYKWTRPEKNGETSSGFRILTDLNLSRNFNPLFKRNEAKATSDTAPWISVQVLKELREKGSADNFREGGTGAVNWAATSLKVKEKVIFPVVINGKIEALHALRLTKGMVVWNNLKNPLVLEYEPLGLPVFTSITGWKLTNLDY